MVNVVLTIPDDVKKEMSQFEWINWSEVAREEVIKKDILQKYLKEGIVNKEDMKFCEKKDWHPVDELNLKKEFVKDLKRAEKGKHYKIDAEDLDKLLKKA